jgi:ketosteroid isomerase-like protein
VQWDNGAMKHVTPVSKRLWIGVWAIILSGCVTNPATTAGPERRTADEAAVRRTLADLERRINQSDPSFVDVFAKDAVIIPSAAPDVVGFDAIRTMYTNLMKQDSMTVHFSTGEVVVANDLAYERGTYTLKIIDKVSGKVLQDVKNKHHHILKRQPDGTWKTWRLMVSSAEPTPGQR